ESLLQWSQGFLFPLSYSVQAIMEYKMTQAKQVTDPINAKLEAKYQAPLQALAVLNFKDMMQMHEKSFPFSAIAYFFLYPIMLLNGEVFRIESPLRFTILYPVLVNRQHGTFAAVFSKGVTFSTA